MSGRGSPAPGGREDLKRGGGGEGGRGRTAGTGVLKEQTRGTQEEKNRVTGFCPSRSKAGAATDLARGALLSAGPTAAPQGLDHGTEPSCGDPISGPTTAQ